MKTCRECGTPSPDNAVFCLVCGTKFSEPFDEPERHSEDLSPDYSNDIESTTLGEENSHTLDGVSQEELGDSLSSSTHDENVQTAAQGNAQAESQEGLVDSQMGDVEAQSDQIDPPHTDYSDAISDQDEALSELKERVKMFYDYEQYELAKEVLDSALPLANVVDDSFFALAADIYRLTGYIDSAINCIDTAIKIAPASAMHYIKRGQLFNEKMDMAKQEPHFGNPTEFCIESRKMFSLAITSAENSNDEETKAIAYGLLAFSFYYFEPLDKTEGERYAELSLQSGGDTWGNADKVLKEANAIREEIKQAELEKENARKEDIYNHALRLTDSQEISELNDAITKFSSIPDYKDSTQQVEKITAKIEEIKQRKIQQKRTRKKALLIGTPLVIICVIIASYFGYIQHHKCGDNLQWKYDEDAHSLTITGVGPMDDDWSFNYEKQSEVNSVIINDGCTSISRSAFAGFYNLTSVEIPDSVIAINDYAFLDCNNLTTIELPNQLTSLGYEVFQGAGLLSLYLPASVEYIDSLGWMYQLESITVDENNANFIGVDGVLYSKDMSILVEYPIARDAYNFEIPNGVTLIRSSAYPWESIYLTSVTIPQSLTQIKDDAGGSSSTNGCSVYFDGTMDQWLSNPYSDFLSCPVVCADATYSQAGLLAGDWYGYYGTVLSLKEDYTCSYVDGLDPSVTGYGSWEVVDGFLRVYIDTLDNELYGQLDNGYYSDYVYVQATDSSRWRDENFQRAENYYTLTVTGDQVNIRTGPSTDYESIGMVSRGTILTFIGKDGNGWYQVIYNNRNAYIIEDYVSVNY